MSSSNNNSNNISDEMVSEFMSFTGSADPERAASYIEMSGGDLQTAVGLYMEHETTAGGGGGGGNMAGGGGNNMMYQQEDAVRAPDETRTMRLMDDSMGMHAVDPSMHLMNAMMEDQFAQSAFADLMRGAGGGGHVDPRAAINAAVAAAAEDADNENDSYDMEEDDDDNDEVQVLGPPEPPRLSDMFAAPTHLMHKIGGFQGARASAKDSKRWLLVNIQADREFSSHALNRDVWRDELVENLIREGFIFWQTFDETPEGRTFVERYNVLVFPHISIIDPRTGRLLWRKEGWTQEKPVTAETFAEMAMDFCSRNSFDRPPQAPRPAGGGGGAAAAATTTPRATQKRPMNEMSEDEQMEAAMRASIEDAQQAGTIASASSATEAIDVDNVQADSKPAAKPSSPAAPSLVDQLLEETVPDEPASGARIQFRMPDGKKLVRKFSESDTVRMVYAFVAQSSEEIRSGRAFSLMAGFPPIDLINDIDSTIADCKLSGQAITVRWQS